VISKRHNASRFDTGKNHLVGVSEKGIDRVKPGVVQKPHPTRYRYAVAYQVRIPRT